ncbi:MAG: alpha/beta hydrolase [Acidimicrobiales bacterium]
MVLVHGWAGNRTYWRHQVDFLADRYRVITLDLGGHGESGAGRSDWNLVAFGDDVAAVVQAVDATNVALVGHSMGGDAIVFAARQLGDRVIGLVWIDAFRSLGDETPASPDEVDGFVAPFRADFAAAADGFARNMFPATADAELVDRVAAEMAGAPQDAALGSLGYAMNRQPRLLAALTEITAPTVAINPDVAPTDSESLRKYGVEVTVLRDVGHFLMLEDPAQFNPVLAATLASFIR